MKFINAQGTRFLIAGGANTLATYFIYLGMLKIADYKTAFTLTFAIGIVMAYLLNNIFVFNTRMSWRKMLQYPLIYILQYGSGLLLLTVMVDYLGIDKRLAPLINVVLLTPVTFMLNKWFLVRKNTL